MAALYTSWYGDQNTSDSSSYILNENRMLGLPRLRQLKVYLQFISYSNLN